MQKDLASLSKAGLGQIHLEQDFDYSSVTQRNAEIIRNYINSVKPKVAFIPFWKARDHYRCTLSNTSLISCRGIGTILMYEPKANHLFNPTVVFSLSLDNISPSHSYISPSQTSGWNRQAQATTLEAMSAQVGSAEEILTVIKPFRSSKNARKGLAKEAEIFESHRMLLVEEGLNDVV